MNKRVLQLVTAILVLVTFCGQTVYATTSGALQNQIDQTQQQMQQNMIACISSAHWLTEILTELTV